MTICWFLPLQQQEKIDFDKLVDNGALEYKLWMADKTVAS